MKRHLKSHLAIIGANTIYGLNYVIAKGIMPNYLLPRSIIFLRVIGSIGVFWAFDLFLPKEKVERKDLLKIAICAIFGVALNQIFFFEGLNLTTPINASIIATVTPILVLTFSYIFIKERITLSKLAGILLGAAGALIVILSAGKGSFSSGNMIGNTIILLNTVSWALYLVLIKPIMEKYSALTVMKWLFLFGFFLVFPFTVGIFSKANLTDIPFNIWLSILFVIFITTAFAYFLNNYSLKRVTPSVNGIYIYLQPLIASFVSIISGKDRLTLSDAVASILILAGVFFVTRKGTRRDLPVTKL